MDSAGRDASGPGTAPEDPEQFEPGSEGPVFPLSYGLVGTAVVLAGGVTILLMFAGPLAAVGPLRYPAHRLWTGAALVASCGLLDETCECSVPFGKPGMNVALAEGCAWALPVNLAAALIATACLRRAIPKWMRHFRGRKEDWDGLCR